MKMIAALSALVLLLSAMPSWASPIETRTPGTAPGDTVPAVSGLTVVEDTDSDYGIPDKAIRGFFGLTLAALEVPGNMAAMSRDDGLLKGLTIGLVKGALVGVPVRIVVSAAEFVTAPFPVPVGYLPILCPEYPFDYANGAPSIDKGIAFEGSPCGTTVAAVKVEATDRGAVKAEHPIGVKGGDRSKAKAEHPIGVKGSRSKAKAAHKVTKHKVSKKAPKKQAPKEQAPQESDDSGS